MPRQSFDPKYSNVTGFTAAMLIAVVFAIAVFGSVAALAGAQEAKAPLAWTLLLSTAASALVASVTAQKSSKGARDELAEQHGMAAFVFSNSAATFVTLVANGVESAERGSPAVENGVTYVIGTWLRERSPENLLLYEAVLLTLGIVALGMVLQGADLLFEQNTVTDRKVRHVSRRSVWLLTIGIGVGSTWGKIPYGAAEVANIWTTLLWCIVAIVALVVFVHAITIGFREFVSLTVNGAVHLGVRLADAAASVRWKKTAIAFLRGAGIATVLMIALYATYYFSRQASMSISSARPEILTRTFDGIGNALLRGATSAAWVSAGLGTIVAARVAFPFVRRVVSTAYRSVISGILKLAAFCWFLIVQITLAPYRLARAIFQFVKLGWRSASTKGFRQRLDRIPKYLKLFKDFARHNLTAALTKRAKTEPARSRSSILSTGLLSITLMLLSSSAHRSHPAIDVDFGVPELQAPELPVQPVDLIVPDLTSPPLEHLDVLPTSLCEVPPAAFDWVAGREDRLEVPLSRCELPPEVRRQGRALIVVSLASATGYEPDEARRAARRGLALAQMAYVSAPPSLEIYVLDLGVAKRPIPLARLRALFGPATGARPVPGFVVVPHPSDALVPHTYVGDELERYLRATGLKNDFTRCALSSFNPLAHQSEQLQPIRLFECGESHEQN